MQEVAIIISVISIVFSIIAIFFGCLGISVVIGLKNSTHSIQYVPVDEVPLEDPTFEEMEKQRDKKPRTSVDIEDIYEHT